ncbi:MAG TPA: VOC family protein [Acidimicrobiia bacterium]|nr:VOC family protein [Acidimicrobiia bacterium]
MPDVPVLTQVNLPVRDMDATVAFYRRLGLTIDAEPGAFHVDVALPNGFHLEFDTLEFARQWDTGGHGATGGNAVLGFDVASADAVDRCYAELTGAGYRGHQPPYDALWGARYAIVDDPDGYPVGIMSPIDRDRRFWPPSEPPRA